MRSYVAPSIVCVLIGDRTRTSSQEKGRPKVVEAVVLSGLSFCRLRIKARQGNRLRPSKYSESVLRRSDGRSALRSPCFKADVNFLEEAMLGNRQRRSVGQSEWVRWLTQSGAPTRSGCTCWLNPEGRCGPAQTQGAKSAAPIKRLGRKEVARLLLNGERKRAGREATGSKKSAL